MSLKVVRRTEVQPDPWGVGTGQYERTMWHLLTPADGCRNCWFAYQETPPGRMGQWHHHSYDELYYVLQGVATVESGDGTAVEVGVGETIFIPAGERHQTRNHGSETLAFLWVYAPPPETIDESLWLKSTAAAEAR